MWHYVTEGGGQKVLKKVWQFLNGSMLCSSEADGGSECTLQTGGSITLSVATTSAPMSLQEREIFRWHHAAWRIGSHSVEQIDTELEGGPIASIVARCSLGKVRKQRHVTVWICVTVTEVHDLIVHLFASTTLIFQVYLVISNCH